MRNDKLSIKSKIYNYDHIDIEVLHHPSPNADIAQFRVSRTDIEGRKAAAKQFNYAAEILLAGLKD
jgi:hypothetical protein